MASLPRTKSDIGLTGLFGEGSEKQNLNLLWSVPRKTLTDAHGRREQRDTAPRTSEMGMSERAVGGAEFTGIPFERQGEALIRKASGCWKSPGYQALLKARPLILDVLFTLRLERTTSRAHPRQPIQDNSEARVYNPVGRSFIPTTLRRSPFRLVSRLDSRSRRVRLRRHQ